MKPEKRDTVDIGEIKMNYNERMTINEWIIQEQGKHFCQCGCGGKIIIKKHHRLPSNGIPNIIRGHKVKKICPYTRNELYKLYWVDNLTQKEISTKHKTNTRTIKRWLEELNVPIKTQTDIGNDIINEKGKIFTYEILYKLYWIDNFSLFAIGKKMNCSNVNISNWLLFYDIPLKTKSQARLGKEPENKQNVSISYDELYNLYWVKELTPERIGKKYNVTTSVIRRLIKELNIPIKTMEEAQKNRKSGKDIYNWKGGKRATKRRSRKRRDKIFSKNPIELNNDFLGSQGHHISYDIIVNIPYDQHSSHIKGNSHNLTTGKGIAKMNKKAFKWLYTHPETMLISLEEARKIEENIILYKR